MMGLIFQEPAVHRREQRNLGSGGAAQVHRQLVHAVCPRLPARYTFQNHASCSSTESSQKGTEENDEHPKSLKQQHKNDRLVAYSTDCIGSQRWPDRQTHEDQTETRAYDSTADD